MPRVHRIGPKIFAHRMDYPPGNYPLIERGRTTEIDWPFRTGRSIVTRLPLTRRALCVGVWGESMDEEAALRAAVGARWITPAGGADVR